MVGGVSSWWWYEVDSVDSLWVGPSTNLWLFCLVFGERAN